MASLHHIQPPAGLQASSSSSLRLESPSALTSARASIDEDRPSDFQHGRSTSPLSSPSLRSASRSAVQEPSRDGDDARGRKHKRFSLANVSNAFLDVVMDRMRSHSRSAVTGLDHEGDITPPRGRARERSVDIIDGQRQREEVHQEAYRERSALERVGAAIGLEMDDEKEHRDGWKEFRKGACVSNAMSNGG